MPIDPLGPYSYRVRGIVTGLQDGYIDCHLIHKYMMARVLQVDGSGRMMGSVLKVVSVADNR